MFRHLTILFLLSTASLLTSNIAQAQYGGLSLQIGGNGYGNSNYRNFGYSNFGYGNPNYRSYGYNYPNYLNYGNFNNRYYNDYRGGGYRYSSPNYYGAPQRLVPVRRSRRW